MGLQTRPTHVRPQTTAQARRAFTSHGPRISTQQSRQLARGAELYERSEKIKDAERRRKLNAKKKAEKEEKEREARRRMGIPSPRAVGKVAASQGLLVGFVRMAGRNEEEVKWEGGVEERDVNVEIEDAEGADFGDDVPDDDSLLGAVEQKPKSTSPVIAAPPPAEWRLRQPPKHTITKAPTSFTGSTDFVLARDITWTQDIEAARSFESELIKSPTLTPEPQPPVAKASVIQDCWDDMLWSNTQIEREIAITPPRPTSPFIKPGVPASKPITLILESPTQAARQATDADDSFLSMLSTQDLTFSSPEFDRCSLSPLAKHNQGHNVPQRIHSKPIELSVLPENALDAHLMPPPPRPSSKTTAPVPKLAMEMPPPSRPIAKTISHPPMAAKTMPPPPRPTYKPNSVMPPPPRPLPSRPLARPSNFPRRATTMVRPHIPQQSPYNPYKPVTTPRPQQQQHIYKHYSPTKPMLDSRIELMTDWIPADFELSTQDCREIGVG